ncbi:hypothetical protein C1646_765156 [Rhizophagus diaphanus]|nr:hypothetical protein C1646_765156 [Rhizophagus diaphanus] [Rhizophagus sp. MUCL 43196]
MASSSSTKHIVIDWSSPPTHSFVQLGLTPTPQKDSNNHVQDFEQEVILTTKDILNTDIDDILSPSSYTAHQPRRKNFPFFVSFKKTHVIKTQYTGFNKIYNFGRSKSFFFEIVDRNPGTNDIHLKIHTNDYLMSTTPISFNSTSRVPNAKFQISKALQYFFSSQRVIPRQIQKKYFNMLRKKILERITFIKSRAHKMDDRNHQTKTFFNFSYKRYRFHFGIYVLCEHHIVQTASSPPMLCQLPSAIILFNNRHGCGSHVKKIFQDITLKNDHSPLNQEKNTKVFHANLIFKQWQNLEWKDVYSKRTGISYCSHYTIPGYKKVTHYPRTHIYNKLMKEFNYQPSPNTTVAKRQQRHFERNCRRVLKKEVVKPGGNSNVASKLGTAKTSNFLFLPSQTINKRIHHIRIQDIKLYPENSGLNFSTPYDHKYKKRPNPPEQRSKSKEITIEPQVMVSPTMTDSEREIANAKELGWDPTFFCNKMKKINNLMNWSDKFHKDRTNFVKQYDRIIMKHTNKNTPDDGQSKKKYKLTLKDKLSTLYFRFLGLTIPNNRKRTQKHLPIERLGEEDKPAVIRPYRPKERKINKDFPLKRWVDINLNLSEPSINPKWSCLDTTPDTAFDSKQARPSKVFRN